MDIIRETTESTEELSDVEREFILETNKCISQKINSTCESTNLSINNQAEYKKKTKKFFIDKYYLVYLNQKKTWQIVWLSIFA